MRTTVDGRPDLLAGVPDWTALFADYCGLLAATAQRSGLTPHEAEDAGQRVWAKVLECRHQLRDEARFAGWLATVARRECLAVRRERWIVAPGCDRVFDDRTADAAGPCESVVRVDERRRLRHAVARLPERERRLVQALLDPSEPSYAQIAASLSMPIGSIGPIRRRALARLRKLLDAEQSSYHGAASRALLPCPVHDLDTGGGEPR